ncbi:MAG: hypothetical protein AAB797_02995, partial [Patescibacteria group bacterium]
KLRECFLIFLYRNYFKIGDITGAWTSSPRLNFNKGTAIKANPAAAAKARVATSSFVLVMELVLVEVEVLF